jgi:hypothetical protein
MRLVGQLQAKRARHERIARHISGPRFRERADQREQDWALAEIDNDAITPDGEPAGVHHECPGLEQCFNAFELERSVFALGDAARGQGVQYAQCAIHFSPQRRNARFTRRSFGSHQRRVCFLRTNAPNRDARNHQLVRGAQRWRQLGWDLAQRTLCVIETSHQQQPAHFEVAGMRRVRRVAMRFEQRARRVQ